MWWTTPGSPSLFEEVRHSATSRTSKTPSDQIFCFSFILFPRLRSLFQAIQEQGTTCNMHSCLFLSLKCHACMHCRCLPESPRWLITQKQNDKAMEVIKRIAKNNKKQLPPSFQVTVLHLLNVCKAQASKATELGLLWV